MHKERFVLPFSAIVDLDKLKLAILINAINPKIGGLLIRGAKGSGKSTVVRALADILPKIKVLKDCPFNCSPDDPSNMCSKCREKHVKTEKSPVEDRDMKVVDLPLGATEDRVIGSLDVEKAIKQGIEALEPGILAEANQNILYVDEVNLLPDHIADDLLDAAATGWNIVEREGISVGHPSRFIFIGTMNPEEGELRPQLLDRFPLSVTVNKIASVEERMEVVNRNIEFEADPEKFHSNYKHDQQNLKNKIVEARKFLKGVVLPKKLLEVICKSTLELNVDGLRPDIVIAKAAMTLAAFENRKLVTFDDILISADFALSHRTRKGGFLEPATPKEIGEIFKAKAKDMKYVEKTGETSKDQVEKKKHLKGKALFWVKKGASEEEEEKLRKENIVKKIRKKWFNALFRFTSLLQGVFFGIGKRLKKGTKDMPVTNGVQKGSNKLRGETYNDKKEEKGEFRAIPSVSSALGYPDFSKGITLIGRLKRRITSPSQFLLKMGKIQAGKVSTSAGKRAVTLTTLHRGKPYLWKIPKGKPRDIHIPATIREATRRQKNREKSPQTALKIHFEDIREKLRLYKAPLTMIFVVDLSGSMLLNVDSVKAALLRLHEDAYRYRDRVGIVALKDTGAIIVQHPITNLRVVAQKLMTLHVSGFTPLATGMMKAREVLKEAKRRTPSTIPVMVIITDGSANVPLKRSLETGEIREIEEVRIIVRDYEDISIRDVISVSKMIKREGIHTIVINTNPHLYGRETYGFVVTKNIAAITNGSHHSIGRVTSDSEMIENMIEHIKLDQKDILHG